MKRFILLLLLMIFLVGCVEDLEEGINETEGVNDTQIIGGNSQGSGVGSGGENPEGMKPISITGSVVKDTTSSGNQGDGFDVFKLREYIKKIAKEDYVFEYDFFHCNGNVRYHVSNVMQDFVIEEFTDESDFIDSYKEFYEYTDEYGYEYCEIDSDLLENITGSLSVQDFETEQDYRDFKLNRIEFILRHIIKQYKLDEGKFIEVFTTVDAYNNNGYFQGGVVNYMLKIYCAPNVIIKMKPRENYLRSFASQTQETIDKNNAYLLEEMRSELLPDAIKLIEFCPVTADFFDRYDVEGDIFNKTYYYYEEIPSELFIEPQGVEGRVISSISDKGISQDTYVSGGTPSGAEDEGDERGGGDFEGEQRLEIGW